MLNPSSPIPLYHQLAELLRSRIAGGDLLPGARLPSEPELSRTHRIGRPTVRQATELLVQKGLVERRRGSGTYVRATPRKVDLLSLGGTLSSFERSGIELETRLLVRVARRAVPADPDNPFGGREAFTFVRVSRTKSEAVLLEHVYLDPAVFPDLHRIPLSGESLSRLVEERYYLTPTHAEQTFRVAVAPIGVREPLSLGAREAVLLVKRTLHFPRVGPAIFTELHCKTDHIVFTQTIRAEGNHA